MVFGEIRPDLELPANYQLPVFSLNNPTPTILNTLRTEHEPVVMLNCAATGENACSSAFLNSQVYYNHDTDGRTSIDGVNANAISVCDDKILPNAAALSESTGNSAICSNIPEFLNVHERGYQLCLSTMADYLRNGSFITRNCSEVRIENIIKNAGYSGEMICLHYDHLVHECFYQLNRYESQWKEIKLILDRNKFLINNANEMNDVLAQRSTDTLCQFRRDTPQKIATTEIIGNVASTSSQLITPSAAISLSYDSHTFEISGNETNSQESRYRINRMVHGKRENYQQIPKNRMSSNQINKSKKNTKRMN